MKRYLFYLFVLLVLPTITEAQDQTVNGDLYIGTGSHDQTGFGRRINFIGNSDNCYITQYNVAGNTTEFRFNIGDDLFDDKFVVGVTNSGDGLWYPKMTVRGDGYVGLGTNDPTSNLHILELSDSRPGGISAPTKSIMKLSRNGTPGSSYNESAEFRLGHGGSNVWGSQLDLYINGTANQSNVPDQQAMTWLCNGNVGIGITNPQEKLAVNGTIHSKAVTVDLQNWPDYVFHPSYQLPKLSDIKNYIDKNHHLPEMPSAADVEKNGLNLGDLNKVLVKKVEELTLFLIEQQKLFEETKAFQQKQIDELKRLIKKDEG